MPPDMHGLLVMCRDGDGKAASRVGAGGAWNGPARTQWDEQEEIPDRPPPSSAHRIAQTRGHAEAMLNRSTTHASDSSSVGLRLSAVRRRFY